MNSDTPTPRECLKCGNDYELREGCDPTPYCDQCAHLVIEELQRELAQAQDNAKEWQCLAEVYTAGIKQTRELLGLKEGEDDEEAIVRLKGQLAQAQATIDTWITSDKRHAELVALQAAIRDCRGLFDLKPGESLLYAIETLKAELAQSQADVQELRCRCENLQHCLIVAEAANTKLRVLTTKNKIVLGIGCIFIAVGLTAVSPAASIVFLGFVCIAMALSNQ